MESSRPAWNPGGFSMSTPAVYSPPKPQVHARIDAGLRVCLNWAVMRRTAERHTLWGPRLPAIVVPESTTRRGIRSSQSCRTLSPAVGPLTLGRRSKPDKTGCDGWPNGRPIMGDETGVCETSRLQYCTAGSACDSTVADFSIGILHDHLLSVNQIKSKL